MGITVIGPTSQPFPGQVYAPIVQVKATWSDDWQYVPELRVRSASVRSAGHGLDSATFARKYGNVKLPWESDFSARSSWASIAGWWVRILFTSPAGPQPVWIGRFAGEGRDVFGNDTGQPSGEQAYTAHGPLQILRKIAVSTSWWSEDAVEEKELGWIPSINDRDPRGTIVGNRTVSKVNGSYLYGQTYEWTHHDYAEYLLARFVDESADSGPAWSLGGQAEILQQLTEPITMQATQSVADILGRLIPKRLGLDYCVFANDDGFVVHVYALSAQEYTFGDETLPSNPNTVRVVAGETPDNVQTRVVQTEDHGYQKVRVRGERILCCCTLRGSAVADPYSGSLTSKWDANLEADYLDGTGNAGSDPGSHDSIRERDEYRTVFRHYGAPIDWDWNEGTAAVKLDDSGQVEDGEAAAYQNTVRKTERWTPLQEQLDYSTDPATDNNAAGQEPDFRPPAVWVGKKDTAHPLGFMAEKYYTPIDQIGLGVQASRTDLGVVLTGKKNHILADNHWAGAKSTNFPPLWDHDELVATIAFATDQRLALEYELPEASPSGGVLDLVVRGAEFWWLAPSTVVGIDEEGHLIQTGAGRELRNDRDRLLFVMAGALSRYYASRSRASILINGLAPWGPLVGQILTVVEAGGSSQRMAAPITAVQWTFPEGDASPTTKISAGFAQ